MKREVSQDDVDAIQRALRTARLALADLELKLSAAGLGSKGETPEKKGFSVEKLKSRLTSQEED